MKAFKASKFILLICLILFIGCDKEDELSDVTLNIKLIDENGHELNDHSGIEVNLSGSQENYLSTTNSSGDCIFLGLPYGIYSIKFEKSGFISEWAEPELKYLETDTVDIHTFKMHELPNYTLSLDSIDIPDDNPLERIFGFGKIFNCAGNAKPHYYSRLFVNDSKEVSKDNYFYYLYGALRNEKINGENFEIFISDLHQQYGFIYPPGYDTLYVRIYPYACTARFVPLREEALGKPSDVFEWIIK